VVCKTTLPVSLSSPLLSFLWKRRLVDASSRYSERLLLVPGVGYGFTDAIERVSASVIGGVASGPHLDNVTVPSAGEQLIENQMAHFEQKCLTLPLTLRLPFRLER